VPVQLAAALQERGAQRLVAAAVAEVPLAAGDDLQRPVALLVELRLRAGELPASAGGRASISGFTRNP
jgi:hypothetical protein